MRSLGAQSVHLVFSSLAFLLVSIFQSYRTFYISFQGYLQLSSTYPPTMPLPIQINAYLSVECELTPGTWEICSYTYVELLSLNPVANHLRPGIPYTLLSLLRTKQSVLRRRILGPNVTLNDFDLFGYDPANGIFKKLDCQERLFQPVLRRQFAYNKKISVRAVLRGSETNMEMQQHVCLREVEAVECPLRVCGVNDTRRRKRTRLHG